MFQVFFGNSPLELFMLFHAQCDPHAMDPVFLCGLNEQEPPAAADVQERHSLLQIQLLQDIINLVHLCLIERIVFMQEIAAGIAQCFIQPELIEIVADVIMALDFLLLILFCR